MLWEPLENNPVEVRAGTEVGRLGSQAAVTFADSLVSLKESYSGSSLLGQDGQACVPYMGQKGCDLGWGHSAGEAIPKEAEGLSQGWPLVTCLFFKTVLDTKFHQYSSTPIYEGWENVSVSINCPRPWTSLGKPSYHDTQRKLFLLLSYAPLNSDSKLSRMPKDVGASQNGSERAWVGWVP